MSTATTHGYTPVNGINMYYELHGTQTGIPLVLVHGGGSTIDTNFSVLLPLLAPYHRIIALELQAHGRTSDRSAPESFEQDADDVAGLLQQLDITKASFLGFSNGGSTTMQICVRHPHLVNKAIVISAVYRLDGFIKGFHEGLQNATVNDMPAPLKDGFFKVNPSREQFNAMFNKDRERMLTFRNWPDSVLESIKAPTLLMAGDNDVMSVEHTAAMARLIEGAQLAILPGTHGSFIGEACAPYPDSKMPSIAAMLINNFLAG